MRAERGATIPAMNAALRTTLGWIAAVLLNVGAALFLVGLIVPRTDGGVPLFAVGIALLAAGLAAGGGWMLGGRDRR